MNGELAVKYLLDNNGAYNAHVGGSSAVARIFYDEAEQTQQLPFCIVSGNDIQPNDTKDGVSTLDFDTVYVTHFAGTKKKVAQMAQDGRTALDRQSGSNLNGINVESIRFITQRSGSEYLLDKKVFTIEQLYQVMTK